MEPLRLMTEFASSGKSKKASYILLYFLMSYDFRQTTFFCDSLPNNNHKPSSCILQSQNTPLSRQFLQLLQTGIASEEELRLARLLPCSPPLHGSSKLCRRIPQRRLFSSHGKPELPLEMDYQNKILGRRSRSRWGRGRAEAGETRLCELWPNVFYNCP